MSGDGKGALVIGGSGDIGLGVAQRLHGMGFRLALAGRTRERMDLAVARLAAEGAQPVAIVRDLGSEAEAEAAVEEAVAGLGRIDVLVNAAGAGITGFVARTRAAAYEEAFRANLLIAASTCRAVLPAMRKQGGGVIVNVASVAGMTGLPGLAAYSASKGALRAFTDSLRAEVSGRGIRVTTISPDRVDTRMHGQRAPDDAPMIPVSDVAETVAFLVGLSPQTIVPEIVLLPAPPRR